MDYQWNIQGKTKNIQDVLRYIMKERSFNKEQMINFISNSQEPHNPFLFKDMRKVIDRIKLAKENNEKVCIIGD